MWDNDNILQVLRSSLGGAEVRILAKEVPCSLLLPRLYDEDIRVARNAAWVLTHKPITQIRTLPYNDLIDLTMATPDICSVPTRPTMILSKSETKLVMAFCTIIGTATARTFL